MSQLPVEPAETSTLRLTPEGLSIHMRIPAERPYMKNAVLTVREICDHLNLAIVKANRIILSLEEALLNSMEHAYEATADGHGQIDLQFSVEGEEFVVVVEDFGKGISADKATEAIEDISILNDRGRGLSILKGIPDKSVIQATDRGTRATMLFYLPAESV